MSAQQLMDLGPSLGGPLVGTHVEGYVVCERQDYPDGLGVTFRLASVDDGRLTVDFRGSAGRPGYAVFFGWPGRWLLVNHLVRDIDTWLAYACRAAVRERAKRGLTGC